MNGTVRIDPWNEAIAASADPARAARFLEQLRPTDVWPKLGRISTEQARIVAAVFAGSQSLSELLLKQPEWALEVLTPEALAHPRRLEGMRRELAQALAPLLGKTDLAEVFPVLRRFKECEMLRIAARDLARIGRTEEILREISDVADACLEAAFDAVWKQHVARFGSPHHQDAHGRWLPTAGCVLGLGKLGGQELNYSSDVDLIFLYDEEGSLFKNPPARQAKPPSGMSSHQFFNRLFEAYVGELARFSEAAPLFRIDLRLRPEGNSGPLARSLASCENYYSQYGQTWERMMLIKARCTAGNRTLAGEFEEMIQPFRYPRLIAANFLGEVAAMKARIEIEVVKAGEIDRNVKLGRGGIREIEFICQSLQLLHAGRSPFLQGAQTLPCLDKLVQYGLLAEESARQLADAYRFLRDAEHRLQMEAQLQTHTLPTQQTALLRLAKLMGFKSIDAFGKARKAHARGVRAVYDRLFGGAIKTSRLDGRHPESFDHPQIWIEHLRSLGFRDPDQSLRLLQTLVEGPGYVHVSPRTRDLGFSLMRRLLDRCPEASSRKCSRTKKHSRAERPGETFGGAHEAAVLSDPDRVLARLDSYIQAYGAKALLYEAWTSNPTLFDLLLLLFDRSEHLAETAIRTPDLVDELEMSGRLRQVKTLEQTLKDLRHGRLDPDQKQWIRRYHQVEFMRIGLRDILGLADSMQCTLEFSLLAEACLQYALETVLGNKHADGMAIIGLGNLGGQELTYGSDLDILFLADSPKRHLPQLQRFAAGILDLLSSPTEAGIGFATDARLRPDGEKGLLVNTLEAHADYYRRRARLWEIQALTRARPVAGNRELGARFLDLASRLTNFSTPDPQAPAARTADWKFQILAMRRRIERERTPADCEALALKTGVGGLIDAEFAAQILCLEHGWHEPNTLRALERASQLAGATGQAVAAMIQAYRELRRVESILRRWSYQGEVLLPSDPAPQYRVAVRCGFASAAELLAAVGRERAMVRKAFVRLFG